MANLIFDFMIFPQVQKIVVYINNDLRQPHRFYDRWVDFARH